MNKTKHIERREILWTLEKLGRFEEYFDRVEDILFKMARYETEPGLENNATGTWAQLFQPALSGTSIPYQQRLKKLVTRLLSLEPNAGRVALAGFQRILKRSFSRVMGDPVIAGRVPPPEWHPKSPVEMSQCIVDAFAALGRAFEDAPPELKIQIRQWGLKHHELIFRRGALQTFQTIAPMESLAPEEVAQISATIQGLVGIRELLAKRIHLSDAYWNALQQYAEEIQISSDRDAQLRILAARPGRGMIDKDSQLSRRFHVMAEDLVSDKPWFLEHLAWLSGTEANSAWTLGYFLGSADVENKVLPDLLEAVGKSGIGRLASGYVKGMNDAGFDILNPWLDQIEIDLAISIAAARPEPSNYFNRVCEAIATGVTPPNRLNLYHLFALSEKGAGGRVIQICKALNDCPGDRKAFTEAAIAFLNDLSSRQKTLTGFAQQPEIMKLVEKTIRELPHNAPIRSFDEYEASRWMTKLASRATLDACLRWSVDRADMDSIGPIFPDVAEKHPAETLKGLSEAEKEYPFIYWNPVMPSVFGRIGTEQLLAWITEGGLERVKLVIRALPYPYIDPDSQEAVVPKILSKVLMKYGADEEVKRLFSMGDFSVQLYKKDMHLIYKQLLDHEVPAIRSWATAQTSMTKAWGEDIERRSAEDQIP